jgi:arabinogalactan oligomer/maltooligosaccharide transport system permease protein
MHRGRKDNTEIIRKIARILLCFLILSLLSCQRDTRKKMIVWTSFRPVEREYLQQELDEFSAKFPDYIFSQLFYAPEELRTNFSITALAGKGPALIHYASDIIGPTSELQVIRPLEDLFDEKFLAEFIQQPIAANTVFQGHLYQIADRVGNHLCLVYNKKMINPPPKTFGELITRGKELVKDVDGDGRIDRYALAWNYTEPAFAVPFIGGFGGWIIDQQNRPTLNTVAVQQAAQLIYDLANKYKIIPSECDYETANALFLDGRVAMIINGPWSWGTYLKNGIDLGLTRIPKIDETGLWPSPMVFPMGYCLNINLKGRDLEVAKELVLHLTSAQVQMKFAREFRIIPSRTAEMNNADLRRDELFVNNVDQMMVGRPMPVITEMRWIWDAMRPAYQGIFTNQITPEQAAVEMQRLAEKLIAENRE